jgi:hypothetical protein
MHRICRWGLPRLPSPTRLHPYARPMTLAELSEEMGLDADDLADLRDVLEMKLRVRCSW